MRVMKPLFKLSLLFLLFSTACSHPLADPAEHSQRGPGTILSTTQPKQSEPSYLKKIDSNLQNLVADYLSGKDATQAAKAYGLTINAKNEVLVDIYINGSVTPASNQLMKMGMTVQATNEAFHVVEGFLPIELVIPTAKLDTVKALLPVVGYGTNPINP